MRMLKLIAMALIVLVALPFAASASATVVASGSVTDGRITSSTDLTSEKYNDYLNVYGVHNSLMGKGTVTYNKYLDTSSNYVKTAYSTLVDSGRAIGSSANSLLLSTKPNTQGCCGNTATTTESDGNCTEAVYTQAVTGYTYDIESGYVESYTDIGGPAINSVVSGEASGTISAYANWNDMSGGCPDVNVESGASKITVSGKIASLFNQFIHG